LTELKFGLHEAQQEIHNNPARFKIVPAGRRFGKTTYAVIKSIIDGLRTHNDYGDELDDTSEVIYVGVTLEQARRNAWNLFKKLAKPVVGIDSTGRPMIHENTSVITLVNGVRIRLLGMDNPDSARGMKLRSATLDEYAQMPEMAWSEIIRPALMDCRGWALFIGTPKGRNHFYKIYESARLGELGPDWAVFNFPSLRNTFLSKDELVAAAEELTRGSPHLQRQEIQASFVEPGGDIFTPNMFPIRKEEPSEGDYFIAVDLAGFGTDPGRKNSDVKIRDEHAIAVVKVFPMNDGNSRLMSYGWWIKEIMHGQWDVRTTAFNIMNAAHRHQCRSVGIEKGALKNAVSGYLDDYTREYNMPLQITELLHNNRSKHDRIRWALEGRCAKGRVFLAPGEWNEVLIEQACGFPSRLVHDDLLDAVAYIDQMAENVHYDTDYVDSIRAEPMDEIAGY